MIAGSSEVATTRERWTIKCADGWVCPRAMSKRAARRLARFADVAPGPACADAPHEVVPFEMDKRPL